MNTLVIQQKRTLSNIKTVTPSFLRGRPRYPKIKKKFWILTTSKSKPIVRPRCTFSLTPIQCRPKGIGRANLVAQSEIPLPTPPTLINLRMGPLQRTKGPGHLRTCPRVGYANTLRAYWSSHVSTWASHLQRRRTYSALSTPSKGLVFTRFSLVRCSFIMPTPSIGMDCYTPSLTHAHSPTQH